jgi:hypothetical protein
MSLKFEIRSTKSKQIQNRNTEGSETNVESHRFAGNASVFRTLSLLYSFRISDRRWGGSGIWVGNLICCNFGISPAGAVSHPSARHECGQMLRHAIDRQHRVGQLFGDGRSGMPNTTELASSWATVLHPRRAPAGVHPRRRGCRSDQGHHVPARLRPATETNRWRPAKSANRRIVNRAAARPSGRCRSWGAM